MGKLKSVLFPALVAAGVTVLMLRFVAPVRNFALNIGTPVKK